MNRILIFALGILGVVFVVYYALFARPAADAAQYRIGILVRGAGYEAAVEGFTERMTELGYVEGENIAYDIQFVSDREKLRETADQFVAADVDLIHVYSTPATEAAYEATEGMTDPTPIVFGSMGDPLLLPAIESIDRPGGNVTGVASLSTELTARRLALLKELDPGIARVAMPHTAREAGDLAANQSVEIAREAAEELGIELVLFPVASQADNAAVATRITAEDVDGIVVGGDSLVWNGLASYVEQAITEKLPLAVFSVTQVEQGALIGIGPDYAISGRQSADIANKILRGGYPGDIPIAIPEKIVLVLNADTAQKIGITIPPTLMEQVDLVVDRASP